MVTNMFNTMIIFLVSLKSRVSRQLNDKKSENNFRYFIVIATQMLANGGELISIA